MSKNAGEVVQDKGNSPNPAPTNFLDRFFKLTERGTNVRTELIAGLTSFLAMSYIIIVNPMILSDAGIPHEAALAATIYASVLCTLAFAFWVNYPVAIAPGMGLNAFFAYTVVIGQGLTWQTALGAVFISGVVFFILTVTGIRQKIVEGVPTPLKSAIGVGIGLFIAFIGFQNAGLIVADDSTIVSLGDVTKAGPLIAIIGVLIAGFFMARNIKGGLLITIAITSIIAMIAGVAAVPSGVSDFVSFDLPSVSETFLQMDLLGAIGYGVIAVIFSFTIVELFDNLATLIGLTKKAGLQDEDGKIQDLDKALQADSVGTMASAALGSTALNAYVENATGISEGGKTGLTALTVAFFFLVSLLFAPLIGFIPGVATAPILIIVGALMITEITNIKFDDYTDVIPVFLTIILMPLTYSIATGLAFGFISYTVLKMLTGRFSEIHWIVYFISIAFVIHFLTGGH
ncbi:NCS2 family permease [Ornithinibacillus halophilus]|uniref:Putative MFS transporter, AGZA family, xanthine/uracil permease n=1 Tax=Ornithinibacillus halophilus TaxID=930117 RepID=A0A1M5FM04_9BACI|nr:NCS2 family permease [Ornithinibacillus halophilus]SHF92525.1 putative MFS transporter, AGZA family, xanthine/uracil permease [Ornithinibacillus halophilus]